MAIKIAGTEVINDNKRVLNNESLPDVRPSLLLDFANSKTLDPRITFTRGSTATYWDGKTTAKAEENLFKYSQEFDNAAWGKSANVTATANSTTAPDGTTTADTFVENDTTTDFYYFYQTVTKDSTARSYTFSTYAKQGSRSWAMITIYDGTNGNRYWFDLATVATGTTLTIGSGFSNISHSISDAGNGWCRLEINFTTLTGTSIINFVAPASADNTETITGVVGQSAIYLWGAQLEQRSSATAYTATTDSPIVKYQPVLQTAASGEARFDHDPVTGESKGLLIEEARTNLFDYSTLGTGSGWSAGDITLTTNVVAPDGTVSAHHIQENTAAAQHLCGKSLGTVTSGDVYALSIHAKADGSGRDLFLTAHGEGYSVFDLDTGTVSSAGGNTCSIVDLGNGWYRCTVVITKTNTNGSFYVGTWNSSNSYTGDGYSGIYVWGAQVEAGSFPTSYIPTSGSTVTRAQDLSVVNNFDTVAGSSVFGLSGYVQVEHIEGAGSIPVGFVDASNTFNYSTYIISRYISGETPNFLLKNGGVNEATLGVTLTETNKALTYGFAASREDVAFTANGLTASTSTTATPPQWVKMSIGVSPWGNDNNINGYVKKIAFYPKRLPNATLQALTEA